MGYTQFVHSLKAKMDLCRKKWSEKSTASAPSLCRCRHDGFNEFANLKAHRTHLSNRERVRSWRFGAAARREEREYPSWMFDRRATPLQRQRSATLRAKFWRRCSSVTERLGYASSSRLASGAPELSALIPYLRDGF